MANSIIDYRCRQCGQRFSVGSQMEPLEALAYLARRDQLTHAHECSPTQFGVADVTGARAPADSKVNDA
jgi:hypothetical protein